MCPFRASIHCDPDQLDSNKGPVARRPLSTPPRRTGRYRSRQWYFANNHRVDTYRPGAAHRHDACIRAGRPAPARAEEPGRTIGGVRRSRGCLMLWPPVELLAHWRRSPSGRVSSSGRRRCTFELAFYFQRGHVRHDRLRRRRAPRTVAAAGGDGGSHGDPHIAVGRRLSACGGEQAVCEVAPGRVITRRARSRRRPAQCPRAGSRAPRSRACREYLARPEIARDEQQRQQHGVRHAQRPVGRRRNSLNGIAAGMLVTITRAQLTSAPSQSRLVTVLAAAGVARTFSAIRP